MLAVGIAYIGATTVIILQLSDLNVSMARLTDRVDARENWFDRKIDGLQELLLQPITIISES